MSSPVAHPFALSFEPAPRRSLAWLLPLVLGLVLTATVAAWLEYNDVRDREQAEASLISDSLSLEQSLRTLIGGEQARLAELAEQLGAGRVTPAGFAAADEVASGMRRRWLGVAWIDTAGRVVAQVPAGGSARPPQQDPERRGLSAHLAVPITAADGRPLGQLVMRYGLAGLLAQETPWWIAQRYEVRMVDGLGEVLAASGGPQQRATGSTHRISFNPPFEDVYLELQRRSAVLPWHRTLPLYLVLTALALLAWATVLTWRRTRSVEQAEAAWQGEAAWRRAMEDSLTVGLRARDLEGRLLYVNRAMCELTGYTEAELLHRQPPMPYWPPDEVEGAMRRHRRNMAGGAPVDGYQARWRHHDGHDITVMLFETPLVAPGGKAIGWLGSVVDVTAQRRAEEIERQRAERLAHHARLMTLGEIAASLAHELNQPLTAVASYAAGVRNALAAQPAPDQRLLDALAKLGEQAAHAGRIVERIRGFLDRREPEREACDLGEIAMNAIELMRPDLRRRGIELILPLPGVFPIDADPVLIEQVVVNLLRNASDAVAGRAAPRRIEVRISTPDASHLQLAVCDNGAGLAGRSLAEIGAPFYSTKPEGMGLGLAICRSILETHRGRLDAHENPAGGACFALILPRRGALP